MLNRIIWEKEKDRGKHAACCKETLRAYFPNTESIIFCEHFGADNIAKGEAGYGAKCDELRGFVFEPLRAYLDGERIKAGLTPDQVNVACGFREKGGMAGRHWFNASQFAMPTQKSYERIANATGHFTRTYESLRLEYESLRLEYEELRQQYECLRRPFSVTADVPYTDVWTFPTVQSYSGKHPAEKPLEMLKHIITASSRPGAVVLDCFAGSGNTLVAAKQLGRQYIGIDIDPHWVDVTRGKLGQTQSFVSTEDRLQWLETQVAAQGAKLRRVEARQQLSLFDSQGVG